MKSLATFVAGVALALSANADTKSFSFDTGLLGTPFSNQTGSLGLFNSSSGTLTGVSFSVSGSESTALFLTNNTPVSQTATATSTVNLFFGSDLGALTGLLLAASPLSLSANTGAVTLAAGTTPFVLQTAGSKPVNVSSIQSAFANIGGGNFPVTCSSTSSFVVSGPGVGNISATQDPRAGCGLAVVYTFTPTVNGVPEPASLALFGAALAGLALVRRKSQKA